MSEPSTPMLALPPEYVEKLSFAAIERFERIACFLHLHEEMGERLREDMQNPENFTEASLSPEECFVLCNVIARGYRTLASLVMSGTPTETLRVICANTPR